MTSPIHIVILMAYITLKDPKWSGTSDGEMANLPPRTSNHGHWTTPSETAQLKTGVTGPESKSQKEKKKVTKYDAPVLCAESTGRTLGWHLMYGA